MGVICKSTTESLTHLSNIFRGNRRVFYSRFGDGDIMIMMGKDQKLHRCNLSLQQEMKEAFEIDDPLYCKGLAVNYPRESGMVRGVLAPFRIDSQLQNFIVSNFDLSQSAHFESAIFLHYLALFAPQKAQGFLDEFIRPKRKLFIGSIPKERVENLIGSVTHYVATPPRNSYHTIDHWWPEVMKYANDVEMIIPATGMATRIVNKRLWNTGLEVQSFDIGSLVDAVDLLPTRKWIRLAGHRVTKILLQKPDTGVRHSLEYLGSEIRLKCYSAIKRW